ncbi:Helicase superfamily 3 [Mollivirus sibericum]|uniref:Helicase superfamily 3 n=1 Tax=Mollivirus sibericum TaxID=1678078 RepID=UPI0006B2E11E|nr:Helicase superfamily 3 [Mollivirus sibericum]ALD62161.1 Helicase superfamily 3 [Mollivirus sibericum]
MSVATSATFRTVLQKRQGPTIVKQEPRDDADACDAQTTTGGSTNYAGIDKRRRLLPPRTDSEGQEGDDSSPRRRLQVEGHGHGHGENTDSDGGQDEEQDQDDGQTERDRDIAKVDALLCETVRQWIRTPGTLGPEVDAFIESMGGRTEAHCFDFDTNPLDWMFSCFGHVRQEVERTVMNAVHTCNAVPFDFAELYQKKVKVVNAIIVLRSNMERLEIYGNVSNEGIQRERLIGKLLESVTLFYNTVDNYVRSLYSAKTGEVFTSMEHRLMSHNVFTSDAQMNEFTSLFIYLIGRLGTAGYMRHNGRIWSQRLVERQVYLAGDARTGEVSTIKFETRSWQDTMSIEAFIEEHCNQYTMWEQFKNLMHHQSMFPAIVRRLSECHDINFDDLNFDRNVFAFRNALFNIETCEVFEYGVDQLPPKSVVACNFIDCELPVDKARNPSVDWYNDLHTPAFQSLLDYHEIGGKADTEEHDEVCKDFYALIGRLFYPVNLHDRWKVGIYIIGMTGGGKSTLDELLGLILPSHDIGRVESEGEQVFGLQSVYDKRIVFCSEMRKVFTIPLGQMLHAISGEWVSVAIKGQSAVIVRWMSSWVFMGNDYAAFNESQGNMSKRLVMVEMNKRIYNPRGDQRERLLKEAGVFMLKTVLAYRSLAAINGNREVDGFLSPYYRLTNLRMRRAINPLLDFVLDRERCVISRTRYTLASHMGFLYDKWCKSKNKHNYHPWDENLYRSLFGELGLEVVTTCIAWNGEMRSGNYVIGLGLCTGTAPLDNPAIGRKMADYVQEMRKRASTAPTPAPGAQEEDPNSYRSTVRSMVRDMSGNGSDTNRGSRLLSSIHFYEQNQQKQRMPVFAETNNTNTNGREAQGQEENEDEQEEEEQEDDDLNSNTDPQAKMNGVLSDLGCDVGQSE